ncbi:MAG: glucose-6-phosphate isomerase, partial [Candidatus Orphnella occulta]|nr:glucose-6-phosphate isomerase [Candidatus Orphnella occulta]
MRLDTKYLNGFILKKELDPIREEIKEAHDILEKGTGPGSSFLGWLHLPSTTSKGYLKEIKNIAKDVRGSCDVFIVVGIGGSYLVSRAAMEIFGANNRDGSTPEVLFAGNSIDPDYLSNLISNIKDKEICINV